MSSIFKSFLSVVGLLTIVWILGKELDAVAFAQWGYGRDATDGKERSGLGLRTDGGTGCQYLLSPWGGLTPRLTADGKHICAEAENGQ